MLFERGTASAPGDSAVQCSCMDTALELEAPFSYKGTPVSTLGYRLYKLREEVEAAAQRGEVKLLNREQFERLIDDEGEPD